MRRLSLALAAAVELMVPDRIVAGGEWLAFENPETARLRGWTLPMARLEGLAALWLAWRWDAAWPGVRPLFGVIGLPALLTPEAFLDVALRTAYENSEEIELRSWVVPFTRLLGLCYVLVAVWPRGSGGDGDGSQSQ